MSSEDEILLMDSSLLHSANKSVRHGHVHPINQDRQNFGENHHLFCELKKDPTRFHNYTRMSVNTFQYVLYKKN